MIKNRQYFPALTGIRAVAAYMVFLMHYNPVSQKSSFLFDFISQFYTGVSIFFVLSGFLITYRYSNVFSFELSSIKKYILSRVARIYPLYFILTTITFIAVLIGTTSNNFSFSENVKHEFLIYILNITFLRGFFEDLIFSLIAPGWSLTVEETFYFVVPFLWIFRKPFQIFISVILILSVGFLLCFIGGYFDFKGFFASDVFMLKFTFFGKFVQFLGGMIVAYLLLKGKELGLPHKTYFGVIILLFSIIALALVWKYKLIYLSIFIDNVCLTIGVSLLIWGLIKERTYLSRMLALPLFDLLGKSSYAFYLIHVGVFYELFSSIGVNSVLFQFILINIIAVFLYKGVESPMQKLILKKYK